MQGHMNVKGYRCSLREVKGCDDENSPPSGCEIKN